GAGGRDHGLALKVLELVELAGLFRHEAVGRDEMGDREGDLFWPLEFFGSGAAFKIDRAIRDEWNTRGGGNRLQFDVELGELKICLHRIDDLVAEVHGVTDDLLLVVIIGKWNRGFTVADRDRARILDFLKCSFLRCRGTDEQAGGSNCHDYRLQTHRNPRKIHAY